MLGAGLVNLGLNANGYSEYGVQGFPGDANGFTVMALVNPQLLNLGAANYTVVENISGNDGYQIDLSANSSGNLVVNTTIGFGSGIDSALSSNIYGWVGHWMLIELVVDGTNVDLYINGAAAGGAGMASAYSPNTGGTFRISGSTAANQRVLIGALGYTEQALTREQIQLHAFNVSQGGSIGLVDEAFGTTPGLISSVSYENVWTAFSARDGGIRQASGRVNALGDSWPAKYGSTAIPAIDNSEPAYWLNTPYRHWLQYPDGIAV